MHDDATTHAKCDVITEKCRNDMFIMMLKRCLCGAWYECIYGHKSPENHLSLLRIWGRNTPCVQLRRRYGSSDIPRQKTRPTYNACVTAWCRCAKAQRGDLHSMAISSNNHTTKAYMTIRLYAWQCLKWHAACLLRAPILGTYKIISRGL